jgi:hypothetical protein
VAPVKVKVAPGSTTVSSMVVFVFIVTVCGLLIVMVKSLIAFGGTIAGVYGPPIAGADSHVAATFQFPVAAERK